MNDQPIKAKTAQGPDIAKSEPEAGIVRRDTDRPTTFLIKLLATTAALLTLATLIVVLFDPFYVYHKPWFGLSAVLTEKEYQVVGSLRNFDYDAVIVGSSMTENSDNALYDQLFDCRSVKAVRSYGGTADLVWYLGEAHRDHAVAKVFYSVDAAALSTDPELSFEASGCPMYLYDRNVLNDYPYWWSLDVLARKIPYNLARSLAGYEEGKSYNWSEGKTFGQAAMLSHYDRPREARSMLPADTDEARGVLTRNLEILSQEVATHPETEYYFYFPCYSLVWWDRAQREGTLESVLYNEMRCMETLLAYDNVHFYNFQLREDYLRDLDLYMDVMHFTPAVNDAMALAMAGEGTPDCRVLPGEAKAATERVRALVETALREDIPGLEASFRYAE